MYPVFEKWVIGARRFVRSGEMNGWLHLTATRLMMSQLPHRRSTAGLISQPALCLGKPPGVAAGQWLVGWKNEECGDLGL